jgi:hypothetical protein
MSILNKAITKVIKMEFYEDHEMWTKAVLAIVGAHPARCADVTSRVLFPIVKWSSPDNNFSYVVIRILCVINCISLYSWLLVIIQTYLHDDVVQYLTPLLRD